MGIPTINRRISFTAIMLKITKKYFNFSFSRTFDEAGDRKVLDWLPPETAFYLPLLVHHQFSQFYSFHILPKIGVPLEFDF